MNIVSLFLTYRHSLDSDLASTYLTRPREQTILKLDTKTIYLLLFGNNYEQSG